MADNEKKEPKKSRQTVDEFLKGKNLSPTQIRLFKLRSLQCTDYNTLLKEFI